MYVYTGLTDHRASNTCRLLRKATCALACDTVKALIETESVWKKKGCHAA